jgi:GNAT superfamily N-acetyltransferase
VAPEAQRQGVARELMRHVRDWAVDNDVDLHLWVTDHLEAAQALYANSGFSLAETGIADWTGTDGEPIVVHRYDWSAH